VTIELLRGDVQLCEVFVLSVTAGCYRESRKMLCREIRFTNGI
jgi:hypothetical protein